MEKLSPFFVFDPIKNPKDLDYLCRAVSAKSRAIVDRTEGYTVKVLKSDPDEAVTVSFAQKGKAIAHEILVCPFDPDISEAVQALCYVAEIHMSEYVHKSVCIKYYMLKGGKLDDSKQEWLHD